MPADILAVQVQVLLFVPISRFGLQQVGYPSSAPHFQKEHRQQMSIIQYNEEIKKQKNKTKIQKIQNKTTFILCCSALQ